MNEANKIPPKSTLGIGWYTPRLEWSVPRNVGWFAGVSDLSWAAMKQVSLDFMADVITPLEHRKYPYRGKTYDGYNFIRKLIVNDLKKRGIKRNAIENFNHLYDSDNVSKMLTVMTAAGIEMFLLVDNDGNGAIVDPVYLALARKGAIKNKAIDFKNSTILRLNQYIEQAVGFVFPMRPAYSLCGTYAKEATVNTRLNDVQPVLFDVAVTIDTGEPGDNIPSPKPYLRGQFKDPKSPGENLIEVVQVLNEIKITDEALKVNSERVVDVRGNTIYEY